MTIHRLSACALAAAVACGGSSQKKDTASGTGDDVTDANKTEPNAKSAAQAFADKCRAGLRKAEQQLPAILAVRGARTLENTLVPYNEMSIAIDDSYGLAALFQEVHPDKAIRDEATRCKEEVAKFVSALGRNRQLYEALSSLDTSALDANSARLVKHELRSFRRSGVDKDEATRARLKAIDEELTRLGSKFNDNIKSDVRSIEIKPEKLAGLPEDFKASHKPGANGLVTITTDYPDYIPFMQYADDGEARKAIYIKFKSRGDGKNEQVLRDILELRAEKAKLLGYANWADYITEDKMAKSAVAVDQFIDKVVKSARARSAKDYKELLAYKRKLIDKKARVVQDWEKTYIENKLKADKYKFDAASVRPYFPYEQVEAGLLAITSKIYGVRYEPVADAEVWHPDVKTFDVYKVDGGQKLGRIYLDMHPRANKYKHAAQFPYRSGVAGYRLPEGVLVCNFPNPKEGPALMEHSQVETMFHEFGHLMHHVLGGHQKWIAQSGVATEWDFVEAPSQMFEEWASSYETLKLFAKHHESGEVIPADMVERMRTADKFGLGTQTLQQMFYASISLNFHTADPGKLDMTAEIKKLQTELTPFPYVEGTAFHNSFGHLNGYSAMYYTYMWSLVIAKDLLTPFKKHGLMNTEWTHKYRDTILVPGGTRDAADLVADFLGRKFNYKAFEDYLNGA